MLIESILKNWETTARDNASDIRELMNNGYDSWTVKIGNSYGVAMAMKHEAEVYERFSGAKLFTGEISLDQGDKKYALMLTTEKEEIKEPFAALCAELLNPGDDGMLRREIISNPTEWWNKWKELLGNKNVDDMVYDVLGELVALRLLYSAGEAPEWGGPFGATYDIDCGDKFYEVKSTIARNKREITMHNSFQLVPPENTELFIMYFQFEPSLNGESINKVVDELIQMGFSKDTLEKGLNTLGLKRGRSARERSYILHAVLKYQVDDKFPAIREESFINGHRPLGIKNYSFTIDLDGVEYEKVI